MRFIFTRLLSFLIFFLFISHTAFSQSDRITIIKDRLDSLAATNKGLNQLVQISVTGVSVKDYINAIARSNNLSFQIDPALDFKVYNTFNNVTVSNILILLAQQYNLDISSIGSIIVVKPYQDPRSNAKPAPRLPKVSFNNQDQRLSLELNNDTLSVVAKRIAALSGRNIMVPATLQNKLVNAYILSSPFEPALEKLAYGNEFKLIKTNDNFYLFQQLEDGEQLYVNGDNQTAVRRQFKPIGNTPSGNTGLYIRTTSDGRKLISVDATNAPIADLVRQASHEMGKNYFVYSEIKGAVTTHAVDLSYDNFLEALFRGTDYTYNTDNGVYMIGDRKLEGLRATKAVQLQNRSIDTVLAMIPADWKRGVEIREFKELNTILLSGSRPQIVEIESFIHQLDQLVPQILIEVTMLDFHNTRTVSTGIGAGVSDSVKTGGSILPGMDFTFSSGSVNDFLNRVGSVAHINLGHVVPSFYVSLKALETKDNVDVRSVPRLTTLNGHTAKLSIGSSRWYKNTTQNVIPSTATSQTILSNEFKETKADLSIDIRPVVSGDDQVTLNINVDISDFIGIPPDNAPPPKSTSKFESIIRAHDQDMIVLGGIERTENSENGSGFPLLSRIPILKYIFGQRSKTNAKVVTVLFIKPTIIR